ncbi:MAG: SGNH/GDSL hydrolase family protein [Bacteroidia bacterium]|nr:SGNH/GDSL hydrolase family protein [Bacteroidia bacterium]
MKDSTSSQKPGFSPYQYLALGDSYTIGEAVEDSERFPLQLSSRLSKDGINCETQILATTGWTTDELINAIHNAENLKSRYDLVTLLIGVNNQYRGYPIIQYRTEFRILLDKAIQFADNRVNNVVVLSIPDYSVTSFGQKRPEYDKIGSEIDTYNQIAEEICVEKDVKFIDITSISRRALKDTNLVADDGLHPSGKMYSLWVNAIYSDAKSIIAR